MMTAVLINIVEVSNVFSVLVVFLVFCVMVVFILRLYGEDFRMTSSVHYNPRLPVQPIPITTVFNPFAFNLKSQQSDINEVVCTVSFQMPNCTLQAFWGVNICDLQHALSLPWMGIKRLIDDQQFLEDGGCIQKTTAQCFTECTNVEVNVKPSIRIDPSDFGVPPRSKYPLVILLVSQTDEEEGPDRRVGAMVNVIHIRDTVVTMASCMIAQYLKMTDGQLSNLKQLFVVSEGEERDAADVENELERSSSEDDNACVVCRSTVASRALLPCRHVCACKRCFSRLDKCPMCRSHIHSYFCVRDEGDEDGEIVETETRTVDSIVDRPRRNWRGRVEGWNDWLNQTFGFTGNDS